MLYWRNYWRGPFACEPRAKRLVDQPAVDCGLPPHSSRGFPLTPLCAEEDGALEVLRRRVAVKHCIVQLFSLFVVFPSKSLSHSTSHRDLNHTFTMSQEEIPKQCKAGVVVNEGPDFKVEVQMVDVPEPSTCQPPPQAKSQGSR